MSFRLRNQDNPEKTLSVSDEAWFSILELAEEYGWNPMGTVNPGRINEPLQGSDGYGENSTSYWDGNYIPEEPHLVLLEDALNLADALERAFLDYEPERLDKLTAAPWAKAPLPTSRLLPGIGAITATINFAWQGAFWIERI